MGAQADPSPAEDAPETTTREATTVVHEETQSLPPAEPDDATE